MRFLVLVAAGLSAAIPTTGLAQANRLVEGRYQPLDQRVPPGVASTWVAVSRGLTPGYVQPIRIELPDAARVSVFSGANGAETPLGTPAQTALVVGHVYRFRIDQITDLPNASIYPTVELIGHLHPPADLKHDFPVRVPFTIEEIELALDGRLITKVIYVEEPKVASTVTEDDEVAIVEVSPRVNVLHEADRRGRPVAIVRLGGRTPTTETPSGHFRGTPPPVQASRPTKEAGEPAPESATPPDAEPDPNRGASLLDRFDSTGRAARTPGAILR